MFRCLIRLVFILVILLGIGIYLAYTYWDDISDSVLSASKDYAAEVIADQITDNIPGFEDIQGKEKVVGFLKGYLNNLSADDLKKLASHYGDISDVISELTQDNSFDSGDLQALKKELK